MKLRPCAKPGCGRVVAAGSYCDEHAAEAAADRSRGEPWRYLYGLAVWKRARAAARERAGYRCEDCGAEEYVAFAGGRGHDVDHVEPLRELWLAYGGWTPNYDQAGFEAAATDAANLRVRCDSCHAREEAKRWAS